MEETSPKIFGVVGSGISYSLSPQILRLLFDRFRLPHGYYLFDIRRRDLPDFLKSARMLDVAGLNVTIPFKCEIVPYLHRIDPSARCCRAVNLVVSRNGRLTGFNTDLFGIEAVFRQAGIGSLARKRVLLLGAGGTARAMLACMMARKPEHVSVVNRGRKRLADMLSELGLEDKPDSIMPCRPQKLRTRIRGSVWNMIFNATPVATEKILPPDAVGHAEVIFEAAYDLGNRELPPNSRVIGGVDMLVFQALRGFELFSGIKIGDHGAMKRIIRRKLAG